MKNILLKRARKRDYLVFYMETKLADIEIISKNLNIEELVDTFSTLFLSTDDEWEYVLSI
jgi:hypothetical protein